MNGPSEAAVDMMYRRLDGGAFGTTSKDCIKAVLYAASDPALGLDRSVRLGDVVEWLREQAEIAYYEPAGHLRMAAAGIEAKFGKAAQEGEG